MRNLSIAIISIAYICFSFTSDSLKSMLMEVYSQERTEKIISDTQLKKYYSNILFHSFSFEEIPAGKPVNKNLEVLNSISFLKIDGSLISLTPDEVVAQLKNETFNILKAQLERNFDSSKSYVLGKTSVVLRLFSYNHLTELQKK